MDNNNQENLTYRSPLRITFTKLIKKKLAVASMVILLILYGSGIFASVLSPYPYTETDLKNTQQGPSQEHFFGTDRLGRDIFTRALWGGGNTGSVSNVIDYVTIASAGDAADFGDLSEGRHALAATSNGHGGLGL